MHIKFHYILLKLVLNQNYLVKINIEKKSKKDPHTQHNIYIKVSGFKKLFPYNFIFNVTRILLDTNAYQM